MSKRNRIIIRDESTCQYCGLGVLDDGVSMHLDHKTPKVLGGDNSEDNLVVSCKRCNGLKGCMSVDEFRDKMTQKINYHIRELNYYMGLSLTEIKRFCFYFE